MTGEEDSSAVLFPRPLLLLEDATTIDQQQHRVSKILSHSRGSSHCPGAIRVQ